VLARTPPIFFSLPSPFTSPARTFLWPLRFSSPYISLAPTSLWPLHFSGHYLSLATTFLWSLPFSGHYYKSRAGRLVPKPNLKSVKNITSLTRLPCGSTTKRHSFRFYENHNKTCSCSATASFSGYSNLTVSASSNTDLKKMVVVRDRSLVTVLLNI
jgi:hypothetical protein